LTERPPASPGGKAETIWCGVKAKWHMDNWQVAVHEDPKRRIKPLEGGFILAYIRVIIKSYSYLDGSCL
jgi:hypothetical protein